MLRLAAGSIVPRGPTADVGRGTAGLLLKALTIAAHGGKACPGTSSATRSVHASHTSRALR